MALFTYSTKLLSQLISYHDYFQVVNESLILLKMTHMHKSKVV